MLFVIVVLCLFSNHIDRAMNFIGFSKVSTKARILVAVLFLMSVAFLSSVTQPGFYVKYVNQETSTDFPGK